VKILLSAYWGPQGWRSQRPATEDLAFAIAEGVMSPPARVSHDEIVARAKQLGGEVDELAASNAFLATSPG
jgi:hypothetical protein